MQQFLMALVCLSTLAIAQNVVVASPTPSLTEASIAELVTDQGHAFVAGVPGEPLRGSHGLPTSTISTMMLFVVGLSGLTAVGGRHRDRKGDLPA